MMMTEWARTQAAAHLETIVELIQRLRAAQDAGDQAEEEAVRVEIDELPLEVAVRSGWRRPGEVMEPEEYQILLCTGGPAVRITGVLGRWGEPITATLEYSDWGTPWEVYLADDEEERALLEFAREFYYGG